MAEPKGKGKKTKKGKKKAGNWIYYALGGALALGALVLVAIKGKGSAASSTSTAPTMLTYGASQTGGGGSSQVALEALNAENSMLAELLAAGQETSGTSTTGTTTGSTSTGTTSTTTGTGVTTSTGTTSTTTTTPTGVSTGTPTSTTTPEPGSDGEGGSTGTTSVPHSIPGVGTGSTPAYVQITPNTVAVYQHGQLTTTYAQKGTTGTVYGQPRKITNFATGQGVTVAPSSIPGVGTGSTPAYVQVSPTTVAKYQGGHLVDQYSQAGQAGTVYGQGRKITNLGTGASVPIAPATFGNIGTGAQTWVSLGSDPNQPGSVLVAHYEGGHLVGTYSQKGSAPKGEVFGQHRIAKNF